MKHSRGGFLSKHLVVVAVVLIKTAACNRGWVRLVLETFARVIKGGLYLRADSDCDRGNMLYCPNIQFSYIAHIMDLINDFLQSFINIVKR